MDVLLNGYDHTQTWLFQHLAQPLTLALGQGGQLEQAYEATGWFLIGLIQIVFMLVVLVPLGPV